jgi:hypothetical protein
MSKYYTDKNGFTARVGDNWNDEKSDQTLKYLTDPARKFSTKQIKEEEATKLKPIIPTEKILTKMVEHGETAADDLMVQYDSATGLFLNKDKSIAYKKAEHARNWNSNFERYSDTVKRNNVAVKPARDIQSYYKTKQVSEKPALKKSATASKPMDIKIDFPYLPDLSIERSARDIELEQRFNEMQEQSRQEKINRNTKGLMSFVGGKFNDN